jgi:hypothetical protein
MENDPDRQHEPQTGQRWEVVRFFGTDVDYYTLMLKLVSCVLVAGTLLAGDTTWKQVQELKSGSELRIYKKASTQPIEATLDQADADRIVVLTKTEQMAISKSDVNRIDARPPAAKTPRKLTTSTTAKTVDPDYTPHPQPGLAAPDTSYNTNVSMGGGSKPDFETVYRRTAEMAKPAAPSPAQD